MYYPYPIGYSLFGVLILVLDIAAIISVMAGKSSIERKLVWTLIILILPVLGLVLYYLLGRKPQDMQLT